MSEGTNLRISKDYRIVVYPTYDLNAFSEKNSYCDWEEFGIVRIFQWESVWPGGKWSLIYGKRGIVANDVIEFNGYSQGDHLRICHNNADESMLQTAFYMWSGPVFGYSLDKWNPEPGVGWDSQYNVGGYTPIDIEDEEALIKLVKDEHGEGVFDPKYVRELELEDIKVPWT